MDLRCVVLLAIGLIMVMTGVEADCHQEAWESRLKVLEERLTNMEALFEGFEQLCNTLRYIKAAGGQGPNENKQKPEVAKSLDNKENDNLEEHIPTIIMKRISSSRSQKDTVTVFVSFFVLEKYQVRWHYRHENGTYATLTEETYEWEYGPEHKEVTTKVLLEDAGSLISLLLVIKNYRNDVQLSFNITSLSLLGTWLFPDTLTYRIVKYRPTMTIPSDILGTEGIRTTLEVTENVVESINTNHYHEEVFFGGINTTSVPAEFVEVFDERYVTFAVKDRSVNEIEVGVSQEYAQYGGLLTIRLPQEMDQGYLRDYSYGVTIRIINQEVKDLMSPGSVAIYNTGETQYYNGPYFSFSCFGVGIPLPDVSIFKLKEDGTLVEMEADEESASDLTRVKDINFTPKSISKPDGTYICRTSNGNNTAEFKSSVVKYVDLTFIEGKTGLTKNTTKVTEISCKASGTPTPDLEVRINDRFEDQLMHMKHTLLRKANTSKVTVTISPPDPSIYSIVCVAKQHVGLMGAVEKQHRIKIRDFW